MKRLFGVLLLTLMAGLALLRVQPDTSASAGDSSQAVQTSTDFYVDDDGSNETGDGSQANPWKTISYALAQVSGPSATIHVAPGIYDTDMGGVWSEVFPINMEDGVSLVGAGADVTILNADQSAAVIKAVNIGDG